MTERYLGSIISPSPVEPSDSLSIATASGVWNIHDPLIFGQAGDWPDPTNVPNNAFFAVGTGNAVEKVIMNTTGNATDFADLTSDNRFKAGFGNDLFGFYCGGQGTNVIDRLTFATGGTAIDFGDLIKNTGESAGYANNVRGFIFGGDRPTGGDDLTVIEFIVIQTIGNSVDFGDLGTGAKDLGANAAGGNATRGVLTEVGTDVHNPINNITYINVASTGSGQDFGDTTVARDSVAAVNNSTRLVFGGGDTGDEVQSNVMDYVTIASTGNGTDFGDLTSARFNHGSASNSTTGLFAGGTTGGASSNRKNIIDSITVASTGNATDFGDLTLSMDGVSGASDSNTASQPVYVATTLASLGNQAVAQNAQTMFHFDINTLGDFADFGIIDPSVASVNNLAMLSNSIRGVSSGGAGGITNMSYFNHHSKGRGTDFGDSTVANKYSAAASSDTRGIVFVGRNDSNANQNVIEYVTIASAGNATDFGDSTVVNAFSRAAGSTTRAVHILGTSSTSSYSDEMDYVTIASTGNATDFGNLTEGRYAGATGANSTRQIIAGGVISGGRTNVVDYITIASTGNAQDFGDLSNSRYSSFNGFANDTRLVIGGGYAGNPVGSENPTMDYFTIASLGNATDFGDSTTVLALDYGDGVSNGHGGIDRSTAFATLPAAMGFVAGGQTLRTTIEFINIASTGNGQMFGDLSQGRYSQNSASSSTRYVIAGGYGASSSYLFSLIDFSLFSTKGVSQRFGDLSETSRSGVGGVSNGTRGVFGLGGGASGTVDKIEYVTIATEGDATDFGNLVSANFRTGSGVNSTTRGIFGGAGGSGQATYGPVLQYITIASTGNATDFGDLTVALYARGAVCSSTRGVYGGGGDAQSNVMDYITIASTGNATDFGDLTIARYVCGQGCSSSTRGVFAGHDTSFDSSKNIYDYITIASTGNATDFGDMVDAHAYGNAGSNSHGGL
jgi:hypothetical protein